MKYKHIFFDLDRTLWDFESNMKITLKEIFQKYKLDNHIASADDFIEVFNKNNDRLWGWYQKGQMKKDVLRYKRFELTLNDFGIKDKDLAQVIGEEYINESPKKTALIPHTKEVLDYLFPKYQLHIITNGFNEVQFTKLKLCGIESYFGRVITSEVSGYHKPKAEAFGYPLSSVNAKKKESIMIGDDLVNDIIGAKRFGMDQVYLNLNKLKHNENPTFEISSLSELIDIL